MVLNWNVENPQVKNMVIVTKMLPGQRWMDVLTAADCQIHICMDESILTKEQIKERMGTSCAGVIGQLTEKWDEKMFVALKAAGNKAYSNYAVGFET